ncbi:hypothetical protein VNO77_37568 [Canavalia gladiata]|uniref:Uncharacterized protein n=1 Tax=Canavalia gladiata TaxID=3824 RepID=A0AAN9KBL2_CANGL
MYTHNKTGSLIAYVWVCGLGLCVLNPQRVRFRNLTPQNFHNIYRRLLEAIIICLRFQESSSCKHAKNLETLPGVCEGQLASKLRINNLALSYAKGTAGIPCDNFLYSSMKGEGIQTGSCGCLHALSSCSIFIPSYPPLSKLILGFNSGYQRLHDSKSKKPLNHSKQTPPAAGNLACTPMQVIRDALKPNFGSFVLYVLVLVIALLFGFSRMLILTFGLDLLS